MSNLIRDENYYIWLKGLKNQIKQSQIKAALAVNSEMILLYWDLGAQIVDKQENTEWGSGFINQLSKDLRTEFPDMAGFSKRNLELIRQWFLFYSSGFPIAKQVVSQLERADSLISQASGKISDGVEASQFVLFTSKLSSIPWGHHIRIVQKIKDIDQAFFYIEKTIENNWSRAVLEYQIETSLYDRQGKAINNFTTTLPAVQSDLAHALLKDPYHFEFLNISENVKEAELEKSLVEHISQFLLELGKGFAYMGRQFNLKIGRKEYRTDLLFYHVKLRAYIIIELKTTEFEPEFIGKLNFYISAINELIKEEHDNPTIGILLCKNKDNYEVEFALKDVNKPIGVSEYRYVDLPKELQDSLPSAGDLQVELKRAENELK